MPLAMPLSADQVVQLSPDDSSIKAARGLVIPSKWPRLEFDDDAVWGECQGSGSKPYQVQVDNRGPAFRCSCPSRKFPCKHGLALLLLLAQHGDRFTRAPAPAWVSEWLASRRQRAENQEARKVQSVERSDTPPDAQAAARREAARATRMLSGVDELERWLGDRLRLGLAQLPGHGAIWEECAARMVDAQLPGLASRLRRIGQQVDGGDHWPTRVLAGLGQLSVLIEALRRIETLPPGVQADVRTALGVTTDKDTVLASGERVADEWLVLGQAIDEDNRLWVRRVWMLGRNSGRRALLLDFAHAVRRFEQPYVVATSVSATLAFYPGNLPLRALVVDDAVPCGAAPVPAPDTLAAALDGLSRALAANPWQWPQPLLVGDGVVRPPPAGWCLQTAARQLLPLRLSERDGWTVLAESGGAPLVVFGEWDGAALRPLSAWSGGLVWTEEGA